ncbi:MAG: hypothetical protein ABW178_04390 [Pseudoxanthomonas sp.]
MSAATAGVGAGVPMLLAGCQHDTALGLAFRSNDRALAVAAAVARPDAGLAIDRASDAGKRRFSACGASFDIPGNWVPEQHARGQWRVIGRTAALGLKVSVRCMPDQVISPRELLTGIDAVRDELGDGPETLHRGTLEYQPWVAELPRRPDVVALLQAEDDGPGRIEGAVWEDPDKRVPDDPPSTSQGLTAIHWSDDDPQQVAQYTALRTHITSSFSAPMPEGHDRTRTL